jgi:2-octaprenyl-6-methoxyphenol hydroxylase
LIADAAHGIHPIAGQGFNQGCKDIALLVDLIKQNLQLGLDIADGAMLDRYQKERALDNRKMIFATNFFTYLFSNDKKVVTLARRIGIKAVDKINPIKKFFIKNAMGA